MSALLDRLRAAGSLAWVRFVQSLNWIAATLMASALIVHQAYPSVITNAIQSLPSWAGIPAIILFCAVVHYALQRAAKAS